jgi:AAA15 family ATPase/GTPase
MTTPMIPKLTSLRLANFRSFTEERVDFGNLTVLIGPNAAGKSNLLEAILFFRDLAEYGLEDAVSLRGGMYWTTQDGGYSFGD